MNNPSTHDSQSPDEDLRHACVINLDHRTDRWQRMQTDLAHVKLNAERFSAIGINDLGNDQPLPALKEFLQRVDKNFSEHKLLATWACMHSHLSVIRMAKEAGWPSVLILEDDCKFEPYTKVVLTRACQQLRSYPWDILYLGGTHKKGGLRTSISKNLISVSRVRLAHAYIVRASIYEKILSEAPMSGLPIDWYYSEILLPTINAFMVDPMVVHQWGDDISDIEQVQHKSKLKTRKTLRRWIAMLRYGFLRQ